jgi:regulator of protease activity HflC (stomatin/prohibitin superfamily)
MKALFALIVIIVALILLGIAKSVPEKTKVIRRVSFILMAIFGLIFVLQAMQIVNAGEVGVQIVFGKVQQHILREGINFKNPFADVTTFTIRLKEYTMSSARGEGSIYGDDSIAALTRDNLEIKIDVSIWYALDPDKAGDIYRSIAKDDIAFMNSIVRPAIRTAIRDVTAELTFTEIIETREKYTSDIFQSFNEITLNKGVIGDKVLVRNVTPPATVRGAIEKKLMQQQELAAKEYELEKMRKDADIRRVEAQGIADAQAIIQQKLTPLYVQYLAIEAYKTLAGSENTTFVILPTNPDAAGMPLILNGAK